jgi:predicted HTH domain antitoxin
MARSRSRIAKRYTMDRRVTIEFGDDILFNLGMSAEQFSEKAKFLLAAKLYELGKLSSGQAARLCGKGRVDFLMSLTRIGIPISNLQPEDAQIEIDFARHG